MRFDPEKARAICEALPDKSNEIIPRKENKEYYKKFYRAGKQLPVALAHIEKIESENSELNMQAELNCDAHDLLLKRIEELEKALIEGRAKRLALDDLSPEGRCLVTDRQISDFLGGLKILHTEAREQLRKEGLL